MATVVLSNLAHINDFEAKFFSGTDGFAPQLWTSRLLLVCSFEKEP